MRATVNRGEDAHTDGKFGLSDKAAMEIVKLFFTKDEDLYDKKLKMYLQKNFMYLTSGYIGELCLLLKNGIAL